MFSNFKPFKACDADIAKLRFPLIAQPKIDGVRGLVINNQLRTRELKPFANRALMENLSRPAFNGFDFEIACGTAHAAHPDLCRMTTSQVNTIAGSGIVSIHVFDDFSYPNLPYETRYKALGERLGNNIHLVNPSVMIYMMPSKIVESHDEILAFEEHVLLLGYEGIILRDPKSLYKFGRATARENSFLRIKRFVDDEAICTNIIEAQMNLNEARLSETGYLVRSSHVENKIGKSMVGAIELEKNGKRFLIGPGNMSEHDRIRFWQNPHLIIGKPVTFKHFPHGRKDAPRLATFKHIRENLV